MKKIVLIGDSIRKGYDKFVKAAFDGLAEVYYPRDNCRFTSYIIRYLYEWKVSFDCGDDVDVVHWNAGLWDSLVCLDEKALVPLAHYEENVDRICNLIKLLFPNAKIIFATSTPVCEEQFNVLLRFNKDIVAYNKAACDIVKRYGGTINDLYGLLENAPIEYHSDRTHFYTKEGTKAITQRVISSIEEVLGEKAKELDYDSLFENTTDIVGF